MERRNTAASASAPCVRAASGGGEGLRGVSGGDDAGEECSEEAKGEALPVAMMGEDDVGAEEAEALRSRARTSAAASDGRGTPVGGGLGPTAPQRPTPTALVGGGG